MLVSISLFDLYAVQARMLAFANGHQSSLRPGSPLKQYAVLMILQECFIQHEFAARHDCRELNYINNHIAEDVCCSESRAWRR